MSELCTHEWKEVQHEHFILVCAKCKQLADKAKVVSIIHELKQERDDYQLQAAVYEADLSDTSKELNECKEDKHQFISDEVLFLIRQLNSSHLIHCLLDDIHAYKGLRDSAIVPTE